MVKGQISNGIKMAGSWLLNPPLVAKTGPLVWGGALSLVLMPSKGVFEPLSLLTFINLHLAVSFKVTSVLRASLIQPISPTTLVFNQPHTP